MRGSRSRVGSAEERALIAAAPPRRRRLHRPRAPVGLVREKYLSSAIARFLREFPKDNGDDGILWGIVSLQGTVCGQMREKRKAILRRYCMRLTEGGWISSKSELGYGR